MIRALTIFLEDGVMLRWNMDFSERGTLRLDMMERTHDLPWVKLSCCRCECCPLDVSKTANCPVAEVLFAYALDLADRQSCEEALVHISEDNGRRIILENVPLQNVVGELVRLAVYQAGCPIGRKAKPVMSRLRPFPSDREILEAFALQSALMGSSVDNSSRLRGGAEELMHSLHCLFGALSKRFEGVGKGDVCVNAVVVMHSLSILFSLSAPKLVARAVREYGLLPQPV